MESYDSILEAQAAEAAHTPADAFNRETWMEQKRAARAAAYTIINEMADKALSDPAALSRYLEAQARFGKTSIANILLITSQKPDAALVMGYDDWQRKGRSVKKGETAIHVLEANGEYERPDGTMGVSFDVRHAFDVSQTYGKPLPERSIPGIKSALKALMADAPAAIRLSDVVPQGIGALYCKDVNEIRVARGMSGNDLFFAVSRELAKAEIAADSFLCDCAANILCMRYNVPPKLPDRIPDSLVRMGVTEKRSALSVVREVACAVAERLEHNLFQQRQKNEPER